MMIVKLLPPAALAVLARTGKSWEALARVVLYRYLDLMGVDGNVLTKWVDVNVNRNEYFEHVRTLFCPTRPFTESGRENVDRFLNSHLERFPKLSYLSLHRGPIPSTLSQSLAKNTLEVLKLQSCSISLDELVTLLNYFCKLKHLSLCYVTGKLSNPRPPQPRCHPEKLTLVGPRNPIHTELLNLSLAYKQLVFDLSSEDTMVQDFIDTSKKGLEYLEFGCRLAGMYHNSPMICPEITHWNPWFCFRLRTSPYILRVHQPGKSRDGLQDTGDLRCS